MKDFFIPFQFFGDARESEMFLKSLQDNIKRKYSCDRNTSLTRLEDLLQDSMVGAFWTSRMVSCRPRDLPNVYNFPNLC